MNKEYRIKKNQDIKTILDHKHFWSNKCYVVYIKKNNEASHFHLAISVSKKYGNAVMRNYAKRQLRSMVMELISLKEAHDIFIIIRNSSKLVDYQTKKSSLLDLLKKLRLQVKEIK